MGTKDNVLMLFKKGIIEQKEKNLQFFPSKVIHELVGNEDVEELLLWARAIKKNGVEAVPDWYHKGHMHYKDELRDFILDCVRHIKDLNEPTTYCGVATYYCWS